MRWIINNAIGVSPDSVVYLDTAENILNGMGIMAYGEPMTHYPPGYPLMLSFIGLLFRGDILQGAIWLHALLFGLNLFLIGFTVLLYSNKSLLALVGVGTFGFATSFSIVSGHAMAWSDPPFITLFLLIFILLMVYVSRPTFPILALLSFLLGFAILVRYIGITLLPPAVLVLLVWGKGSISKKLQDILFMIFVSISPLVVWFARNWFVSQTLANRESSFQFLGFHLDALTMLSRFYDFVLPIIMPVWLKAAQVIFVFALMLWGIWFLHRRRFIQHYWHSPKIVMPAMYLLFFLSYIAFMIFSQLFIEVRRDWDYRILLPAFLALAFLGLGLLFALSDLNDHKLFRLGLVFIVGLSLGLNSFITILATIDIYNNGQGYSSSEWRNSEMITAVNSLDGKHLAYSNGPDALWFWTRIPADMIPRNRLSGTRQSNPEYEKELSTMCNEINQGLAYLIYFDDVSRPYLPTLGEIEGVCGTPLPVLSVLENGLIYGK
jgi:hypothetical protein